MLIDIDDALLARHQELLMKLIEDGEAENLGIDNGHRERTFEREEIVRRIINITTTAYYKRDDNEKG